MRQKSKTRTMFMHTIDGKPADYERGEQITFASPGRYARRGIVLVPSIKQIRAEENASRQWRIARGCAVAGWDYGYVRVEVPA